MYTALTRETPHILRENFMMKVIKFIHSLKLLT